MKTRKLIGTCLNHEGQKYQFIHIESANKRNRDTNLVLIAWVEDTPELWYGDNEHRTESVAELAAYHNLLYPGLCHWIDCLDHSGFRNPTTPYSDQNPELYKVKEYYTAN